MYPPAVADKKEEIVAMLRELSELTVLDEADPQSFRARAYENAMHEIKGFGGDIAALSVKELVKLPGIGKSTAEKIRQFCDTGKVDKLEGLRSKYPAPFLELARLPGLGPKTLLRLRGELGVENMNDLRAALQAQKLRELKGLGAKVEEKLLQAIERMATHGKSNRRALPEAYATAHRILLALCEMKSVKKAEICGSVRRLRDTIADVDIVTATQKPVDVMERFRSLPEVKEVIAAGDTKTSIVTRDDLQVDLRAVSLDQYGAALVYFTGSKAHNIKIRQRALARGWTLNEYGLCDVETGKVVASKTEKDIYDALGMAWVPPSLREDLGEVEAASDGSLPVLERTDIRGIVHGEPTEELCQRLLQAELEWVVVTGPVSPKLKGLQKNFPRLALLPARPEQILGTAARGSDFEAAVAEAEKRGQVIEIEGNLRHLDPPAEMLQRARGRKVLFALAVDGPEELERANAHALRGWIGRDRLINAWSAQKIRDWLNA